MILVLKALLSLSDSSDDSFPEENDDDNKFLTIDFEKCFNVQNSSSK
jgi:hypothetical protein